MDRLRPILAHARERSVEWARSGRALTATVLVVGLIGGGLLIAAEFSAIVTVDVLTAGTCEELATPAARDACDVRGFEQHGGAMLLLGIVALVMALGAARGARPAAFALIAIGGLAIAIALLRDLPKTHETGLIGLRYDNANASAQAGFYFELIGAALCVFCGALRLVRPPRRVLAGTVPARE